MADWVEKTTVGCGKIMRYKWEIIEMKCSSCNLWCSRWLGQMDYKYCPSCGKKMGNEKS